MSPSQTPPLTRSGLERGLIAISKLRDRIDSDRTGTEKGHLRESLLAHLNTVEVLLQSLAPFADLIKAINNQTETAVSMYRSIESRYLKALPPGNGDPPEEHGN